MSNNSFDFKQFSIHQDRCAMKVGTDGVLLGAWAPLPEMQTQRVLDIGTGTGLISLMLAQRLSVLNKQYHIDALEIDPDAAAQAQENFLQSPWATHIQVILQSLQDFSLSADPDSRYDLIVSNPPFYNATLKPDDEVRAIARHWDSLPPSYIISFARHHLNEEGFLCLIYPTDYDTEVMTAATLSDLHIIQICDVVTKFNKPSKRRMATFAIFPKDTIIRQILTIRDEYAQYTQQYLSLVNDFYLHLK